jgi:hypothetical protein
LFYLGWGWLDGSLSGWASTLRMEYVEEYFARDPAVPRIRSGLLYLGLFLLGCGGIPVLGLVRALCQRSPQDAADQHEATSQNEAANQCGWERTAACLVLGYLAIILGAGYKNLHYLGPILPITLVLWLRGEARLRETGEGRLESGQRTRSLLSTLHSPLATCVLAICIGLCWPPLRPTFTLNRELGAATTFQTDSLEEAYRWGRIAPELYERGDVGWEFAYQSWVGYAELEAAPAPSEGHVSCPSDGKPRPLVVTDRVPPSPEYQIVFESADGVKLYSRDRHVTEWLACQHPLAGAQRYPWVFPKSLFPSVRQRSGREPQPRQSLQIFPDRQGNVYARVGVLDPGDGQGPDRQAGVLGQDE